MRGHAALAALVALLSGCEAKFLHVLPCEAVVNDNSFHEVIRDSLMNLTADKGDDLYELMTCADETQIVNKITGDEDWHVVLPGFDSYFIADNIIRNFPANKFTSIDYVPEGIETLENVQAIVFTEDEGGFVVGVLAGEIAKEEGNAAVGLISGTGFDSVRKFRAGYISGVKRTCPECAVISQTISSFNSPISGEMVASKMIEEDNIKVLFAPAGGTGSSAILSAATNANPIPVIGVDADQYVTVFAEESNSAKELVVSSIIKRLDSAAKRIVEADFAPQTVISLGSGNNGVDLADCHDACSTYAGPLQAAELALTQFALETLIMSKYSDVTGGLVLENQFFDQDNLKGNSFTPIETYGAVPDPIRYPAVDISQSADVRDEIVYMFGGVDGDSVLSDKLFSFRPATMSWTYHSPSTLLQDNPDERPGARDQATLVSVRGDSNVRLVLFGGRISPTEFSGETWVLHASSQVASTALERWTLQTPTFESDTGRTLGPRYGHSSASVDGLVYVFGGRDIDGNTYRDLWAYQVNTDTWTEVCEACGPAPRFRATLTYIDGILVLHGGRGQDSTPLQDTWKFTSSDTQFTRVADAPAARSAHQAVPLSVTPPGKDRQVALTVLGGELASGTLSKLRSSVMYYLVTTDEWVDVPFAATESTCGVVDDGAIVIGSQADYLNRRGFAAFPITGLLEDTEMNLGDQNGKLFIFGGNGDNDELVERIDLFHPSENDVVENFNFVPFYAQATLISMACAVVFLGVGLLTWTHKKRRHPIVLASQIPFLAMVAVGAMVTTLAVPLAVIDDSRDEEELSRTGEYQLANVACQAKVWLYGIGFMLTFTPLFAKVYRVQKIFNNTKLKRITITSRQLALTCFALLCVECGIILAWQVIDPLLYVRKTTVTDAIGNRVESVGGCESDNSSSFLLPLVIVHLTVLFYGNYLCWKARKIEDKFAETQTIALVLVSLLQILVLAIPVMILVIDIPLAYTVVENGVILLQSASVLIFIFGKKIIMVRAGKSISGFTTSDGPSNIYDTSNGSDRVYMSKNDGLSQHQAAYLSAVSSTRNHHTSWQHSSLLHQPFSASGEDSV